MTVTIQELEGVKRKIETARQETTKNESEKTKLKQVADKNK